MKHLYFPPLLVLAILLPFQNCSQSSFQSFSYDETAGSLDSNSTLDNTDSDKVGEKSCLLNSITYAQGTSITGYALSSATYPTLCGGLTQRTCLENGQFDGVVPLFAACTQRCSHPDNSQPVNGGQNYQYYTLASGTQSECTAARVSATCQSSTGRFSPTPPANRYLTCLVQGQTCPYTAGTGIAVPTGNTSGSTVTGYAVQSAVGPTTLCGSPASATCQSSGAWSGSTPKYSRCVQYCTHPVTAQAVEQGTTYSYYTISSGSATQCQAAYVTSSCQSSNGLFRPSVPSARYTTCSVVAPPPSGQGLFFDDFNSGNLSQTANGIRWGESKWDTGVVNGRLKIGYTYLNGNMIVDSEQRFSFGSTQRNEIWIKYDLTIPQNYNHIEGNNKAFLSLWSNSTGTRPEDGYSDPNELFLGLEFVPQGNGESQLAIRASGSGYDYNQGGGKGRNAITRADFGQTVTLVIHVKTSTIARTPIGNNDDFYVAGNGVYQIWKNGTKIMDITDLNAYKANWSGFNRGYLFGWTNGRFREETTFYIDNFAISGTNIFGVQ